MATGDTSTIVAAVDIASVIRYKSFSKACRSEKRCWKGNVRRKPVRICMPVWTTRSSWRMWDQLRSRRWVGVSWRTR